jgi:macrolide transport system ATP-binding/permease protein
VVCRCRVSDVVAMPREGPEIGYSVIKIEGVKRTFVVGDVKVEALRGDDLIVRAGEFIAIMGRSGSGKSTLMKIMGCLDRPTSGHYFLEGVDVAGLKESDLAAVRSERLGFVFQSFNLLARAHQRHRECRPTALLRGLGAVGPHRANRAGA